MTQQRQRTGAVVRQSDRKLLPEDFAAVELIVGRVLPFDERAVVPREAPDLRRRDRVERAAGTGGTAAQRDGQHAPRFQEGDQLSERPRPVRRGNVHPDRADQDDVECEAGPKRLPETGQRIGDPLDAGSVVPFTRHRPESG